MKGNYWNLAVAHSKREMIFASLFCALAISQAQADIVKCKGTDGKIKYSDTPCSDVSRNGKQNNLRSTLDVRVNHYALISGEDEHLSGTKEGLETPIPIYQYRFVGIMLHNSRLIDKNAITIAVVADSVPILKLGDLVEVRYVGIDVVENADASDFGKFDGKQEINIVFRLICKADAPNYKHCLASLPIHSVDGMVKMLPSNSPYPAHWQDAGITLTPRYTMDGILLANAPIVPSRTKANSNHPK